MCEPTKHHPSQPNRDKRTHTETRCRDAVDCTIHTRYPYKDNNFARESRTFTHFVGSLLAGKILPSLRTILAMLSRKNITVCVCLFSVFSCVSVRLAGQRTIVIGYRRRFLVFHPFADPREQCVNKSTNLSGVELTKKHIHTHIEIYKLTLQ